MPYMELKLHVEGLLGRTCCSFICCWVFHFH